MAMLDLVCHAWTHRPLGCVSQTRRWTWRQLFSARDCSSVQAGEAVGGAAAALESQTPGAGQLSENSSCAGRHVRLVLWDG